MLEDPVFSTAATTPYPALSAFDMSAEQIRERRRHIGGSDAKIIVLADPEAVLALWEEKTFNNAGKKSKPKSLNMYMGTATEALNAAWYMDKTGDPVTAPQMIVTRNYDGLPLRASLDGLCKDGTAIWEAKHVSGYDFQKKEQRNIETVAAEYYAQMQHNMLTAKLKLGVLSVLFDTGRHEHMTIEADPFYQDELAVAEWMFWQHVRDNTSPGPIAPVTPGKIVASKTVDMSTSADWGKAAKDWLAFRDMSVLFDKATADLKSLMEPDALKAIGHGVSASRDKRGSVRIVPLASQGDEGGDQ